MSAAFTRGTVYYGRVPHPDGGSVIRRLSRDKGTAKAMESMLAFLREKEENQLLHAIIDKRLTVAKVYASYPHGLKELKAELNDRDIEPLVSKWHATIAAQYPSGDTAKQYVRQVRSLIPKGTPFPLSGLTVETLESWVYGLSVASGTKLRYHAAMASFCEYLKRTNVIDRNPMRDVPSPKGSEPRVRYLPLEDVIRLVRAQEEPYRTASALAHCGIELGAILRIRRRDVNEVRQTIHVRGTKTTSRDRVCYIADWAWPFVSQWIRHMHPDTRLVAVTRTPVYRAHRDACEALQITDYRIHDGRHSYAVRLASAGAPLEIIAKQLGHKDIKQCVRCYARFRPTEDDTQRWERIAAAKDAEEKRA